ncbi:hypothetical protein KY309_02640 [Candidatus Woesearchaeota archaeon]|nr:hypothetical protein [Candidatus Woesearchaeota archaeon]
MYRPIHVLQGLRYFSESLKQKFLGSKKYKGSAHEICAKIVKDGRNGVYFQASPHHYREFWTRDFGYCAGSLVKLGYLKEVKKTLAFALEKFSKTGIKTTISRDGIPFSFPNVYSPDSVALLLHALRIANDKALVKRYKSFLQREVDAFSHLVLEDGRVRRNIHFSGMRDYALRDSSCYDHCMAVLLAREAKKLGFKFAYTEKELVKKLDDYWRGYYCDDRSSSEPSGDANALPYWLGVGRNFDKSLRTIRKKGLDVPLPLKYGSKPKMIKSEVFVPNWETQATWPFLGFIWLQAVRKYKPALAKKYRADYAKIIEKYSTLYEVYMNGRPYRSLFYHADEGMLWSAMFLTI